ncbi:hypothetical protein ACH5AG_07775 [Streptomyces anulatus]
MGFAEVVQEAADALGDALVALDLAVPPAGFSVGYQLLFSAESFAQSWSVLGCGDELRAGQVEVALAGPLLGQAQAAAEFEFGLVEVGLQPVQRVLVELPGAQGVSEGAGDGGPRLEDGLVVGQDGGSEMCV